MTPEPAQPDNVLLIAFAVVLMSPVIFWAIAVWLRRTVGLKWLFVLVAVEAVLVAAAVQAWRWWR